MAVAAVTPPSGTNLSFELAGNNAQGEDSWLETTTIAHDGKSARAWVLQAWRNGWLPGNAKPTEKPATWRFYEFQCEANVRHRNPAWIQLDPKLDAANTMKVAEGEFTPPSSQPQKQIAKRVCNNRPMLFSETFKGSDKELIASWYNAAAHVGVAAKPVETPRYTAVDLGPTIRFTILDGSFKYTGAFTRESPTSYLYKGEFHPDTAPASTIKDTLSVLGIRNGMLYLNSNYRESPYAIPVTNGKVSGKGILYSERGDDDFSWSLIEPTTVALKAAPVAPTPVPAPAVPAPVPVAPKPAPVVPAAPAPAPAAPAAKSAMNIQYDAAGWRVFTADSTHAIAWADAHAPAGAPPRLHIMYTFAVDTHFNASPRDARTYYWTIDLDCAGNKFRLEQDRYLNQNGIEINVNPSQTNWRAAAQLQEAEPVMKQKCSGATPTGDLTYGAARSTHTWLQTKIVR